jgi:hypothetical protein
MTIVSKETIEGIWQFLNVRYQCDLPYPDVNIIFVPMKDWAKVGLFNCEPIENNKNEYENEEDRKLKEKGKTFATGAIYYARRGIKEEENTTFGKHEFTILLCKNYIGPSKLACFRELGIDRKQQQLSYVWSIMHEFTHILEEKLNRQLITAKEDAFQFADYVCKWRTKYD